jgi:hypothetical protein
MHARPTKKFVCCYTRAPCELAACDQNPVDVTTQIGSSEWSVLSNHACLHAAVFNGPV